MALLCSIDGQRLLIVNNYLHALNAYEISFKSIFRGDHFFISYLFFDPLFLIRLDLNVQGT